MKKTSLSIRIVLLAVLLLSASLVAGILSSSNPVSALTEDLTLPQPTNICGKSGLSSVDLTWDRPTDARVTGHVVEYQIYGASSWSSGPAVTEVDRVTVPGVNGTRYKYRVASTDDLDHRSAWGSYCLMGWGEQAPSIVPSQIGLGPLAGRTVSGVSAGSQHSCAVTSDGKAACWGFNGHGQLGTGGSASSSIPVPVFMKGALIGKAIASISAGQYHTCAVTSDGKAACWGGNYYGQIGNATINWEYSPIVVSGGALAGKKVTSVSVGSMHSCAVTSDGKAACWGLNSSGQLGDGSSSNSTVPVAVDLSGVLAGKSLISISAGRVHTCAVSSDGLVACWGDNSNRQLGDGFTFGYSNRPVAVDTGGALTGRRVTSVSAGNSHSCALLSDGSASCWGTNNNGELGFVGEGGWTPLTAVDVEGALSGKTVTSISAGGGFTCATLSDGTAACWGDNSNRQLGDGTTNNSTVPVLVDIGNLLTTTTIANISAGYEHVCATFANGTVMCWGKNLDGQLGNGTKTNSEYAASIVNGGLDGVSVADVSTDLYHSCVVTTDGAVVCWGSNMEGAVGGEEQFVALPRTVTGGALAGKTASSVSAGRNHSCAVLTDGTATCWGSNSKGQLGDGTNTNSKIPVAVVLSGSLSGKSILTISAGQAHTCATLTDGTAACWGSNVFGEIGNGGEADWITPVLVSGGALAGKNVSKITAGSEYTCAVLSDGTAACWGKNDFGRIGNQALTGANVSLPSAVSIGGLARKSIIDISSGESVTCAVVSDGTVTCWGQNVYGQIGNGTFVWFPISVAVPAGSLTGKFVEKVFSSSYHSCALASDGTSACWGLNNKGQLGSGSISNSNTPVPVNQSGFSLIEPGPDTVTALSDGSFIVGDSPTVPLSAVSSAVGRVVTSLWSAPVYSGAGPVTGYRTQFSYDAGRTWSAGSDWSLSLSSFFTVPRDGYVRVRVQAKNAAAESLWAVAPNEVLVQTSLSLTNGKSVTKSNVTVSFQTPSGDPVVGSSVAWRTVDGTKRGVNPVVTDADGAAKFGIINTGPVIFTLTGGRVGSSKTKISSASLTDIIAKSGASITVILPLAPTVVSRTVRTSMPDDAPVPGVALSINGGVSGTTSTGVTTNLRSFTSAWSYDGWVGRASADADGVLKFAGFLVPSIGDDVTATFSDGEIEQDASGSLAAATTELVFDQMPVVQMVMPSFYEPGSPVTVTVIAVDGTGEPIDGASVHLETVSTGAMSTAMSVFSEAELNISASTCQQKLSAKTGSRGRVTLKLCPSGTKKWRADGPNIVPSKPSTLRPKSVPNAPVISRVTATKGTLTVTFTRPSSDGGIAITNYEFSTDNGTTWKAFSPAKTSTPLVITKRSDNANLVKGRTYQVKIRAVNTKGKGGASATKLVVAV